MRDRPSIIEVVSHYTDLKRSGREYLGHCPLHSEKTPSFTVNEEKGVFYCHGCHEGGDVITLVQKIEGLDFKTTLNHLGLHGGPAPTKREQAQREKRKRKAHLIKQWAMATSEQIGATLWFIGHKIEMAKGLKWTEELERLERVWTILSDLDDDLFTSAKDTIRLYNYREDVARLLEVAR